MRQHILSLVEKYIGRWHQSGEENVSCACPFHQTKDGAPFSINVTNGAWQCFTCHISGSLPKLLRGLGLARHIVDAELKDIRKDLEEYRRKVNWLKQKKWEARDPFLAETILPETLLKPYEWCPLNLLNAGFDLKWLHWLDIGFDRNNKRVMYPIRDIYGNLAGMSGGSVIAGTYPKYKVYLGRRTVQDHEGKPVEIAADYGEWFDELFPEYTFHNHNYLWNYDQVYPSLFFGKNDQDLIIVEGFKACIWLLQHGWTNTVALMGSSMSDHQRNLIHRLNCRIILFLDNDKAGRDATDDIARRVRHFQPGVRIARYPDVEVGQPDDFKDPADISAAIMGAETYPQWKRRTGHVNARTKDRRFQPQHR